MTAVTQDLIQGEGIHARSIGAGPVRRDAGLTGIARVATVLGHWHERAAQRRQLSGLTPWELDDVGISADAAAAEAAKPFWRA